MSENRYSYSPPLLTAGLSGIGGRIKTEPEDFEVEEIPAYDPCGEGDFLYLWIEKCDMGAEYFTRQLAARLGIAASEVGSAGLKDRRAVTRQMISVPATVEERLPQLDGDGIKVLSVNRHTNKLKPGHLRGNRFRILIREPNEQVSLEKTVNSVVEQLRRQGLPNFYGAQRFGNDGETARTGLELLRGEKSKKRLNPFLRKLALSAAQSVLFNSYLAARMEGYLLHRVLDGDVMSKWPAGGLFTVDDVEVEQQRFDARETVTTGPIFGRKTFSAQRQAAEREAAVLTEFGLNADSFRGFGKLLQGTRRHNLAYVDDLEWSMEPEGVRLNFSLPAGSYATVLLGELMKTELNL